MSKTAIPQLVGQLLQDGVALARAEVQLFKSRVSTRIAAARTGLIFLAAAGVVAIVSLIALVTGLVLALLPYVGAALAGVIVMVGGLLIAGILGWIGAGHLATKPETIIEKSQALVESVQ